MRGPKLGKQRQTKSKLKSIFELANNKKDWEGSNILVDNTLSKLAQKKKEEKS